MPVDRMSRDEFYAKLAPLGEEDLRKALWTLYWRGPVAVRERVEGAISPQGAVVRTRAEPQVPNAAEVRSRVREFAALARAGAYLGRDRRVSPKERTRWRFTFRELTKDSLEALRGEDLEQAAGAVAMLVDLACEMRGLDYVRSEDPVEAARFVVSDAVAALWSRQREVYGVNGLLERAVPKLVRWESAHGWTRFGMGWVAERETSLARVLAGLLVAPESWHVAAELYRRALDEAAGKKRRAARSDLAEWEALLDDRLAGSDG